MAHTNVIFDRPALDRPRVAERSPEPFPPYALAVPLIAVLSAGMWFGIWHLGKLAMTLLN